ncbi:hypothetical protein EOD39_21103 [Acipenser ruthenus]|uniref:Uncharacterized protein n=1 Tax=Acipenser ruthenus TaxID=7906 RepID=A0A444UTL6_ACIRT|nr:hypothetical protein EOD39_21103 [Acipenser ruthenus]
METRVVVVFPAQVLAMRRVRSGRTEGSKAPISRGSGAVSHPARFSAVGFSQEPRREGGSTVPNARRGHGCCYGPSRGLQCKSIRVQGAPL